MRVLLVEDDPDLSEILLEGFREEHMETAHAATIPDARERTVRGQFDVIVLDIMLPGGNGFDFCQELRARHVTTPILMLTARDAVDDRVRGLDVGADDYLTKPFAFRELLARIRVLARRPPSVVPEQHQIDTLFVDLRRREVRRGNRAIILTAKEFLLLEFFVLHVGEVVDRSAITAHVWDENHDPFTNALEVLVRRLRSKIDDGAETKLIQTWRGAGYRFGT